MLHQVGVLFDLFEDLGTLWVDDIKMDVQEVGWRGITWIDLVQDRSDCVNAIMNLLVPLNAGNLLTS